MPARMARNAEISAYSQTARLSLRKSGSGARPESADVAVDQLVTVLLADASIGAARAIDGAVEAPSDAPRESIVVSGAL